MKRASWIIVVAAAISGAAPALAEDSAQVAKGKELYTEFCQRCHGADGQRGEGVRTPIWGPSALHDKFQNAQELFDYLQFTMPFDRPEKVTDEQRWFVIAYMMVQHGAMKPGETLDPSKATGVPIKASSAPASAVRSALPSAPSGATAAQPVVASASFAAGEVVFQKCSVCHNLGTDARQKTGPQLNGIVGRTAGSVAGFDYSPAYRRAGQMGFVWTEDELLAYLEDPRSYMPKSRMAFAGLASAQERLDLITFLKAFP